MTWLDSKYFLWYTNFFGIRLVRASVPHISEIQAQFSSAPPSPVAYHDCLMIGWAHSPPCLTCLSPINPPFSHSLCVSFPPNPLLSLSLQIGCYTALCQITHSLSLQTITMTSPSPPFSAPSQQALDSSQQGKSEFKFPFTVFHLISFVLYYIQFMYTKYFSVLECLKSIYTIPSMYNTCTVCQ